MAEEGVADDFCWGCGLSPCECDPAIKCYDCGGSGSTIEGWTCETCEGTGEIEI